MIHDGGFDGSESFGKRVRSSRQRLLTSDGRRWTQGVLANAVGVERNTVSRWENGGMLPKDPAILAALAQVLRVSADWLLGGLVSVVPEQTDALHEHTELPYGQVQVSVETLPPGADDLVFRYLERLLSAGCTRAQTNEAERLIVQMVQHNLSPRPFSQRDIDEVLADVDAAWDFVTRVMRRQGLRP